MCARIAKVLQQAQAQGLEALDAQYLLLWVLGRELHDRAWLRAHDTDELPTEAVSRFEQLCQQRLDQVPLAYLIGQRGFYGLELHVDARVLDPRPDTETLVDWALQLLPSFPPHSAPRVLDLGTGSGAIALAIKHQWPQAQVDAVDASAEALAVARQNAAHLGLEVAWCVSDWFEAVAEQEPWHLLVSNPPYIAEGDVHLAALRHEPRSALTSGPEGLDDLRQLIHQAPLHLVSGGWLLLEHGYDQADAVAQLLQERGFVQVQARHDLAGIARCTGAQWLGAR